MPSSLRVTEVSFEGPHSTLRIRRPAPGLVVLVISGTDVGEHGDAPFVELETDVRGGPFHLVVDPVPFDAELAEALAHTRR